MDEVSERLVLELFNESHVAIWACDRDFQVVLWNRGAEEIYGFTSEEIIGRNYLDMFVDEAERDASLEDCRRIIDTGRRYKNLLAYDADAGGRVRYMLTNCFRITDRETGKRFQAEIGVEISDLELRKDEHRTLRELGIARRESRRYALERDRDEAVLRVGRIRDEVKYMRDRTIRELDEFVNSASERTRNHVQQLYEREFSRVTTAARAVDLELENIELRCRSAETAEDLRAALERVGDDIRGWTDRVRSKDVD
ncbi:PAS domain-containing protein [Plantactinospora veratri]|uniref:PAS domain-containing protein n=1 Tax=Plantactinospora veratri TaxID=1436122 RepID=A0ABU7S6X0_9ACTN